MSEEGRRWRRLSLDIYSNNDDFSPEVVVQSGVGARTCEIARFSLGELLGEVIKWWGEPEGANGLATLVVEAVQDDLLKLRALVEVLEQRTSEARERMEGLDAYLLMSVAARAAEDNQ